MAPHRNHVEARSSRVPARQFVSETHDHKPTVGEQDALEPDTDSSAPTTGQIYVGLGWTKDIIVMRAQDVTTDSQAIFAAIKSLSDAFERQSMIGVKEASRLLCIAATSLQVTARKINDDASVLQRKAGEHLNRRSRP